MKKYRIETVQETNLEDELNEHAKYGWYLQSVLGKYKYSNVEWFKIVLVNEVR